MGFNRSDVIPFSFLLVTSLAGFLLLCIWLNQNKVVFWKWAAFAGLAFDAIGALMLALGEVGWVREQLWPELLKAKRQLTERGDELGNGDDGFDQMVEITKDRRSLNPTGQEDREFSIRNFAFYGDGGVFARVDSLQVSLGSKNLVGKWISEELADLTRGKITPYAITMLLIGFILQLLAYWFLNIP